MLISKDKITERVLTRLGDEGLLDKIISLHSSDFNTLLLRIFQKRASKITPINIVKAYRENRFSVPSEIDPVAYRNLENEFLTFAQKDGIKAILLSPAAPFACSSAFGYVDQNNVVSAVRGVEMLSDPTNMLAIHIAEQIKNKKADNKTPLHLCATARVLRAQAFPARKGYYSHFGLFCIVSSGKDAGSYACERELLKKQLVFYRNLFIDKYNAKLTVELRKRRGYTDGDGFYDKISEMLTQEFPGVPLSLDSEYEDNNYYKGVHFTIYMEINDERIEIADGGFVDWMRQMTNDKRERCLISGVGLDRLLI